jgi:acetyl esterase/lipase
MTEVQSHPPYPEPINVWPGLAPGESTSSSGYDIDDRSGNVTRRTDVTLAQLFVHELDDNTPHPAVLVCPGGGYFILASDLEGFEIARWLNTLGFVAAVLHYRVPDNRDGALADAQRAISVLRANAAEFGIDPNRLGALGFSAGGHLTARLTVTGNRRIYHPIDDIDNFPCAPDFGMPIYPAYLVDKETGDASPDAAPNSHTPPMFLAQTEDDDHYCTTAYAEHLTAAGVDFTNHVYSTGGHGYGLRASSDIPASKWPKDAAAWLQSRFGNHPVT